MHKIVRKNVDLRESWLYINRELSWIEFNRRVLEEAEDDSHPLLERLKFIAIFSSNLDEFFMIRVAGLKEQHSVGVVNLAPDGMSAAEQLAEIRARLLPIMERQTDILKNDILPKLVEHAVRIHPYQQLTKPDKQYLKRYFVDNIFPLVTPLAIDPAHPFPQVLNRSLNIIFVISEPEEESLGGDVQDQTRYAVLQLPPSLSRFVKLGRTRGHHYVLLEEIIQAHSDFLFPGYKVRESHLFRVSRDADIEIAEDEASDLLREMEEQVRQRRWGAAVRLEIEKRTPDDIVAMLADLLSLGAQDIYRAEGPLNLQDFMMLSKINIRELRYRPFATRPLPEFRAEGISVFDAIRKRDLMVHHPFDSFSQNVVKFLNAAATDPKVLAIKITLYRTGGDSPVVAALKKAVENGKQVIAFIELKARFDEANNIIWAKALEKAGVHVIYGVIGLKTHCKITMVVRKEEEAIRTYLHLSTGNYNQTTARLYTDTGYFTARPEFGADAINLFNYLTGYSDCHTWKKFAVAPINLITRILGLIDREADKHSPENPGEIIVKVNSLVDARVIRALYRASQRGVKVKLIVRGICGLRPNIPGVSDNIEVRSILGRFLEHTRIFYFRNGGEEELYLSSADWMPRNIYRRVETMFPIPEENVKAELKRILDIYWRDNMKARRLLSDGSYERLKAGEDEAFSAQQFFLNELQARVQHATRGTRIYTLE